MASTPLLPKAAPAKRMEALALCLKQQEEVKGLIESIRSSVAEGPWLGMAENWAGKTIHSLELRAVAIEEGKEGEEENGESETLIQKLQFLDKWKTVLIPELMLFLSVVLITLKALIYYDKSRLNDILITTFRERGGTRLAIEEVRKSILTKGQSSQLPSDEEFYCCLRDKFFLTVIEEFIELLQNDSAIHLISNEVVEAINTLSV